ncbi:MAG: ATP-binding protein [Thermoleophilia bacterium]|jgi:serine/threonine-protein kinase RsbW
MEPTRSIKFIIDSRLDNIPLIGGAVRGIASTMSIDDKTGFHLELCAVEAVTNAVKHAYSLVAGNLVELRIFLFPDYIVLEVCDRGRALDLAKVRPLDFDPQRHETLPVSGMGFSIMSSLMDEVSYETNNHVNILRMTKHLATRRVV